MWLERKMSPLQQEKKKKKRKTKKGIKIIPKEQLECLCPKQDFKM